MTHYEYKQRRKAFYIPLCVAGKISERKCASILNMHHVSVHHLKKRYKEIGELAFVNGHRNLPAPNKKYTPEFCRRIISIYNADWSDTPFSTFCDALQTFYKIKVPYNTLRRIMHAEGIKPPRTWSTKEKQLHKPRKERPCAGELLQLDASTHDWFMNDTFVSLHGAIDDATHKVTGLYFCLNECRLGYNEVLRQTWQRYGVPAAVYIDRHSSFVKSKKKVFTLNERLNYSKNESTHFNDLCEELSIDVILALSPQGKGRIERLWQTLQGRLPFIFRFLKIDTIEKANRFISEWLEIFNMRYSVVPASTELRYKKLPDEFDLDYKLSVKFSCVTDSRGRFTFHECDFVLCMQNKAYKHFELCLSEQFGIRAFYQGQWYDVKLATGYLQDCRGDRMPAVEKDLISRYLLSDLHSDYA